MTKTTLELNGRRYDAHTGQVIDGFLPVKPVKKLTVTPAATPIQHVARPQTDVARSAAHHVKPHNTEHSKTLMRHVVKKPPATATDALTLNTGFTPVEHHTAKRLAHAQQIHKSSQVSRFGRNGGGVVPSKTVDLPVQPAPTPPAESHAVAAVQAPPISHHHLAPADPLAEGLKRANSLQHPTLPRRTRAHARVARKLGVTSKVVAFGTSTLAAVLLIGFIAYQNVPNLSLRLAANKAGIHASLPGYQPSGFALKTPIQYAPGQITLTFKARADQRQFQLTQQTSKWNNDALINKFVAVNDRPYQTFQSGSKTIYIYDHSNATWLDKGLWYQVAGNSSLNSDQLLSIAKSL